MTTAYILQRLVYGVLDTRNPGRLSQHVDEPRNNKKIVVLTSL